MRKRNLPENKANSQVKRETESIPWRYCVLTLFFGVLLVIGFFFAARQHFSAIDYGMKNGELKKRRDELEDENRRLTLAKEKELSMPELEKKAREFGLVKLGTKATQIVSEAKESIENVKEKATKTFLSKNQEPKAEIREPKAKNIDKDGKKEIETPSDSSEKKDSGNESNKKSDKESTKSETKTEKDLKVVKNLSKTGR